MNSKNKCKCGILKDKYAKICRKCYYLTLKGQGNPLWKGDKVGLDCLHNWVRRRKPKPNLCECCKTNPPKDLANISQEYKRDINDFEWLCRSCHMRKDGRINNLKLGRIPYSERRKKE